MTELIKTLLSFSDNMVDKMRNAENPDKEMIEKYDELRAQFKSEMEKELNDSVKFASDDKKLTEEDILEFIKLRNTMDALISSGSGIDALDANKSKVKSEKLFEVVRNKMLQRLGLEYDGVLKAEYEDYLKQVIGSNIKSEELAFSSEDTVVEAVDKLEVGIKFMESILDKMINAENPNQDEIDRYTEVINAARKSLNVVEKEDLKNNKIQF